MKIFMFPSFWRDFNKLPTIVLAVRMNLGSVMALKIKSPAVTNEPPPA